MICIVVSIALDLLERASLLRTTYSSSVMAKADSDISAALTRYRQRMASSNRAYMTARINSIEQTAGSDEEHLNTLAKCWRWHEWPPQNNVDSVKRPRDILEDDVVDKLKLNHDGTQSPAPENERKRFLLKLEGDIQRASKDCNFSLPSDYVALLEQTDGIWDMDFRRHKPGVIHGTKTEKYGDCLSIPYIEDCEEEGWEITTGWNTDHTLSTYTSFIYCRKLDSINEDDTRWSWRVLYSDRYTPLRVFANLAAFLDYQSDWYARLKVESASLALQSVSI